MKHETGCFRRHDAPSRERARPKLGKIDIDYQKLHDAFFKWQTKPEMTIMGELYFEGKVGILHQILPSESSIVGCISLYDAEILGNLKCVQEVGSDGTSLNNLVPL